ncbi:MAG: ketol-acid reductoisomerase [Candidatus Zixiibacteriota bacterium]
MRIYKDKDANLRYFKGKKIAIIGYGSQGQAQALNLRDSGMDVLIGLHQKSKRKAKAKRDGFTVYPTEKAAEMGNLIAILAPDHLHKDIFDNQIKDHLKPEDALIFAHAFSIHFDLVIPPKFVDVILVAPHGPGELIRQRFLDKKGITSFIAVQKDYSKKAKKIALAYAKAIGATRGGAMLTTFRDEAIGDLFGEQAVLCGGLAELLKSGFETLVEDGLPPENAYLECVHQIDLIVELIKKYGIAGMYNRISQIAEYGSYVSGKKVINKDHMKKILAQVKNGTFTKKWLKEQKRKLKDYNTMKKSYQNHLLDKISKKLRSNLL